MTKRWVGLFAYLVISQVQAASFDCAKASTKVEKLICANAELSKLDEALAVEYADALKLPDTANLKTEQKSWLKGRNQCTDDTCIQAAYRQRIEAITLSSPLAPLHQTKRMQPSVSAIIECSQLNRLLRLRRDGKAPSNFELIAETSVSGDRIYLGLDIDNDERADRITLSCGTSTDAICTLFVDLATGGHFELEESQMYLAHSHGLVWAIVGDSLSKDMRGKRRAYRIDGETTHLICNKL